MTLSIRHAPAPWDRTLPKPSALLTSDGNEVYTRRGTSLLQHHVVGRHLFGVSEACLADNGRRRTVAGIPPVYALETGMDAGPVGVNHTHLEPREDLMRERLSSVMSIEDTSRSSSPTSTSPVDGPNSICICQRGPKIPRPRNAFILYRQHHHTAVVAQNPGLPNPDISKIIGEQWRRLPDQAKEEWKALAEDEKVRHSQQYPDYRYKPRRNVRSGGQSSVSGPARASGETSLCQKCGGKSMNAPPTPFTPTTPGVSNMPPMNARMSTAQPTVSPPHSARMRQYLPDAYGRPILPPHDPRFQYAPVQQRAAQIIEGPESKKRRFNGDSVYATRARYADQPYQRSPHERTMSEAIVASQFHRPNMGPPARTGYPVQMQPSRSSHPQQQHRRDHSLTLPPLKTPLSQQVPASLSTGTQSQKSGIEAMIMSIPVLNKIKILSQIAPSLPAPGPASPSREIRGAIIAVEGMDPTSVFNMTNTLAEQLEKEDKFAVRIFGGPDPYAVLASSNRASNGEGEHLDFSGFLDLISQWHKISKEMQEYITKKPRQDGETPEDIVMSGTTTAHTTIHSQFMSPTARNNSDNADGSKPPRRPKSPVSAVSPKTITQTADMSLQSPPPKTNFDTNISATQLQATATNTTTTTQPKPRIPASAIAHARSSSHPTAINSPPPTTTTTTQLQPHQQHPPNPNLIPIALVPHYQLTTVDTSSIAMPITDAYSPHSHWQWLATLWRGCTGPDVTVIITQGSANDPPTEEDAPAPSADNPNGSGQRLSVSHAARGAMPVQQQQQQQDVEVRLMDCRAVVVRAPGKGRSAGTGTGEWEGVEWWEKAKRRVGFEVEEFLRR